jgi:hypothetical protein
MGGPLLRWNFTSVGAFLASWGGKREVELTNTTIMMLTSGTLSGRAVSGAAVSEGCGQGNVSWPQQLKGNHGRAHSKSKEGRGR